MSFANAKEESFHDPSGPEPASSRSGVPERLAAQKAKLDALLEEFVSRHSGGDKQRSEGWYQDLMNSVGGSEMAAILGMNPYRSFWDVVLDKAGVTVGWDGGSIECHFGTMFEDIVARLIEIDCGTTLRGTEICIRIFKGQRYSSDGMAVVGLRREADGQWTVWTTSDPRPPDVYALVMVEIKSPYRRMPTGQVPRYYKPQLWAGLVAAPLCHFGLLADVVFRRASLAALGPSDDYDTEYHSGDRRPLGAPVAWGLTAVYAPRGDAPVEVRIPGAQACESDDEDDGDEGELAASGAPVVDYANEAWQIFRACLGLYPDETSEVLDLGDAPRREFDRAMAHIARGGFPVSHTDPCLGDGRGSDLTSGRAIGAAIERMRWAAPPDHFLLGVIPWKVFALHYIPIERRPGFRKEMEAAIGRVMSLAAEARASGDAAAYLQARMDEEEASAPEKRKRDSPERAAMVDALCDGL